MLVKEKLVDALNKQVGSEFGASSQYVAMAIYFDDESLPELANFFYRQAEEEREHAMKIIHYLLEAGAYPLVPAAPEPKNHFETAEEAVELALHHEQRVTEEIHNLVDLAAAENDHTTHNFLQWFVEEQLEEVSTTDNLLRVVRRASETNLLLVEDYLSRQPAPHEGG